MNSNLVFDFTVDKENKAIYVKREFAAELETVWDAWTKSEQLDQWWAPKPWRAKTKVMDFSEGGMWLYAMVSPEDEVHWSRVDFKKIAPQKSYSAASGFCDAEGNLNPAFALSFWSNVFQSSGDNTIVDVTISFEKLSDLETIIAMGFKGGFTMGLGNLDEFLAKRVSVK